MRFGFIAGDTSKTIYVRLRDSTTGLAKTGLAYNSAGAVASYTLPLAARAAITLATQTVTGAWSSGGFVEVDATNCKGLYRFDLPNAAIASGDFSIISIEFDGIIEESVEIELAVPKANVTQWLGTAAATPTVAGVPEVDVTHWIGTAAATPTVAGVPEVDITHLGGVAQSATDLKDFADTGYNPVTHYIAGIEGTLNQFDDLNNAVTAPTAIQNRQEMDTNSTQLAAIVDDTGTSGVVLANDAITAAKIAANAIGASELAADAAQEIADALLDRATAIEGYTPRQAMRLILAALAAKLSGAATTTVAIRDIADTKDRITATVDADGNRTAVTLDAT